MANMNFLEGLGQANLKAVELIAKGSQRLLRHIAYDSYEPMESQSENGTQQPDVDGFSLIYNPKQNEDVSRINPVFKMPRIEDESITMVNVMIFDANANSSSNNYIDAFLNVDIIYHVKNQLVKNNYRHLIIASEIDKLFNKKFIEEMSIADIIPMNSNSLRTTKASDEFLVTTLRYKLVMPRGYCGTNG